MFSGYFSMMFFLSPSRTNKLLNKKNTFALWTKHKSLGFFFCFEYKRWISLRCNSQLFAFIIFQWYYCLPRVTLTKETLTLFKFQIIEKKIHCFADCSKAVRRIDRTNPKLKSCCKSLVVDLFFSSNFHYRAVLIFLLYKFWILTKYC